jgi:hypothetical protein
MGDFNMSTVQIDGSSAVTAVSTKNKGGTVVAAGSAASGVVQSRQASTYSFSAFASTVIDGTDTDDANGGTFAYNNQRPIAIRYTTALAGVSNTFLRSGSSAPGTRRVVNKTESVRTNRYATAIRAGNYNLYTGQFSSAPTVAVDSFGTDNAASPTSAVPGSLVYKIGNPVPFSADYPKKTNF